MSGRPLSFSGWRDFDCPYRAYRLRIAKDYKEPGSEAMLVGSLVHECIGAYLQYCVENALPSDLSFFSDNKWKLPQLFKDKLPEDRIVRAYGLIENFKESEYAVLPEGAQWVQVEQKMAFDSALSYLPGKNGWFHQDVAFRAVVDFAYRIGNTLYIVDWKTGYGDADELQFDIYAYLVHQAYEASQKVLSEENVIEKIVCTFSELATHSKSTQEYNTIGPTLRDISRSISERMQYVNSMTEWPATVCRQCKWCTVPGCPIKEEVSTALVEAQAITPARSIGIPTSLQTQEDAEKALTFLLFAENIIDQIKDLLRGYVEANGPVYSGGKAARFSDKESWKPKDLATLAKTLSAWGVPKELLWNNLSLTKAAMEKVVKKAKIEPRMPFILPMLEVKRSKVFGISNDKVF